MRVVELWNRFWFGQISPYPIALFRVLFGCYLLLYFLGSSSNISLFYSNKGVYCPVFLSDIAPDPSVAVLLYAITVLLIVALIAGYRARVVAPLVTAFYLYHFCLNIWTRACSFDRLIIMSLLILCLAPCDQVLSVSAMRRKVAVEQKTAAWATRLLAIHVALFYLSTGIYKMLSPDWQLGEMIKSVMTSEYSSDLAFAVVAWKLPSIVYDFMAHSVIVFELVCPFAFFISTFSIKSSLAGKSFELRHVQYYFFALGILFHTGIALFMQIPQFFVCPVFYVLFIRGEEIERFFTIARDYVSARFNGRALPRVIIEQPTLLTQAPDPWSDSI